MKKRYIIDETIGVILVYGVNQTTIKIEDLIAEEKETFDSFKALCDKYDVIPVVETKLKQAILGGTTVVIIGDNDKTVVKLLIDLSEEHIQPLAMFVNMLSGDGIEPKSCIYTKATNTMEINGNTMPASDLGQSALLDEIEAVCVELLNQ